jgi:hypothetical protein
MGHSHRIHLAVLILAKREISRRTDCPFGSNKFLNHSTHRIHCKFDLDMTSLPSGSILRCKYPDEYLAFTWSLRAAPQRDICQKVFNYSNALMRSQISSTGYCAIRLEDFSRGLSMFESSCELRNGFMEISYQSGLEKLYAGHFFVLTVWDPFTIFLTRLSDSPVLFLPGRSWQHFSSFIIQLIVQGLTKRCVKHLKWCRKTLKDI